MSASFPIQVTASVLMSHDHTPTPPASSASPIDSISGNDRMTMGSLAAEAPVACACGSARRRSSGYFLSPDIALKAPNCLCPSASHSPRRMKVSARRCPAREWFPAFRSDWQDGLDRGLQLADVIGLSQHRGARLLAQRLIEVRAVITGRDHDRQIGARLAQLQSECIAAAVRQSDVDHREDERLIAGRDLARGPGGRDLDRLIAELFERIHRECGDEHLVLHEQYLSACAHSRLLRAEPGELRFLNLQSTPAATS